MMAIDGSAPDSFLGWLSLGGIVLATAVAATLIAAALGHFIIVISRRIRIALEREVQIARRPGSLTHVRRLVTPALSIGLHF